MKTFRPWIICLAAALFFSYELVQLHMLNALSPHIMSDMNLSATDLATLSSSYLLADVIFLIPAGLIIDRFSVRQVLLTALAFCVLGTFGLAFSQTLFQASLAHFLSGIGNAFCFLSCMILANGWFPKKSTFVMSFMVTMGLMGGVLAQVPFSLLAEALNWRNALFVDAMIGIFIWVINFVFIKDPPKENIPATRKGIKDVISQLKQGCMIKETWICGFYTGFMNLPLMIISAMVGNLFLTQVHQLTQTKASFVISMISFGTIIGSSFFGFLAEKYNSKKKMMTWGAFSSLIVFSSLFFSPQLSLQMLTLIFFLIGFLTSTQVLGYPMISDASPSYAKGTAMGVAALIIMGTAFILQPITGILLDWGHSDNTSSYLFQDFTRAFALFPIAFGSSFLLSFFMKERLERSTATQAIL